MRTRWEVEVTERVLGKTPKQRARRVGLLAPFVLVAALATLLIAASSAPAINTNAGDYSIQIDTAGGRNDEPGQKDLTLQGTDTSDLPTEINVLWNWDETSVGGGNTLDGCALFDSDGDGNVNFAFCAIVGNISNSNKTLELKSTVLYTCGDNRNDRCTQPVTVVPTPPRSAGTTCQIELNSATNPFAGDFPGDNPDTRIFCTVVLADVGAANAVLINTCSYPSQEPNSDPSDCVVVPGKANPTISSTPSLIPQDSITLSNWDSSGTGGTVTFKLYKDEPEGVDPGEDCDATEEVFSQTVNATSASLSTSNDGTPTDGYTITTAGLYLWQITYTGNDKNNAATQACGVERYNITVIQ